jgi:hypothetical protein
MSYTKARALSLREKISNSVLFSLPTAHPPKLLEEKKVMEEQPGSKSLSTRKLITGRAHAETRRISIPIFSLKRRKKNTDLGSGGGS